MSGPDNFRTCLGCKHLEILNDEGFCDYCEDDFDFCSNPYNGGVRILVDDDYDEDYDEEDDWGWEEWEDDEDPPALEKTEMSMIGKDDYDRDWNESPEEVK